MYKKKLRLLTNTDDFYESNLERSKYLINHKRSQTDTNLKRNDSFNLTTNRFKGRPLYFSDKNETTNLILNTQIKNIHRNLICYRSCSDININNLTNPINTNHSYRIQKKFTNVKNDLFNDPANITANYFGLPNNSFNVKGFKLKKETNEEILKKKLEGCKRLLYNDGIKEKINTSCYRLCNSNYKCILPNTFYNRCFSPSKKYLVSDLNMIKGKFLIENNKIVNKSLYAKNKLSAKELLKNKETQEFLRFSNWK
ncbi:MAG: hypothetical protein MJ252_06945 [archaeon]|nr:hypothetical protein [archaeon]